MKHVKDLSLGMLMGAIMSCAMYAPYIMEILDGYF